MHLDSDRGEHSPEERIDTQSTLTLLHQYCSLTSYKQRWTVVKYFYSAVNVLFKCLYFIIVFL